MLLPYSVSADQASGSGSSWKDALTNAALSVITLTTGIPISRDMFESGEALYDAVVNTSAGIFSDFTVVSKKENEEESVVDIEATVDPSLLQTDDLAELLKDKVAYWNKVQGGLFRDRSVLVVYDHRGLGDVVPRHSEEVISLIDKIENQLASLKFDVMVSDQDLATLEREKNPQESVDAIVVVTLQKALEPYAGKAGVSYMQVTARLKAYDTHTQRVLANFPAREKDLASGNPQMIKDAHARLAGIAGDKAASELARNIVSNYRPDGAPILLVIRAINEDQMDALIEGLEEKSIIYKVEKYVDDVLQMKLITELNTPKARRIIRKIASTNDFKLNTHRQEGDTLEMSVEGG